MSLDMTRLTSAPVSPTLRKAFYDHPTDTLATIEAAGYFNAAYAALPKATILEVVAASAGTPVACDFVVTASSASGVTIAAKATS